MGHPVCPKKGGAHISFSTGGEKKKKLRVNAENPLTREEEGPRFYSGKKEGGNRWGEKRTIRVKEEPGPRCHQHGWNERKEVDLKRKGGRVFWEKKVKPNRSPGGYRRGGLLGPLKKKIEGKRKRGSPAPKRMRHSISGKKRREKEGGVVDHGGHAGRKKKEPKAPSFVAPRKKKRGSHPKKKAKGGRITWNGKEKKGRQA